MPEPDDTDPTLESVLVALQKTFSRVSARTALVKNAEDQTAACALILGPVKFQLSLSTKLNAGSDKLNLSENGPITLSLEGTIQPDIRTVAQDNLMAKPASDTV